MNDAAFELTKVGFGYGDGPVLDGLDLSIEAGQRIALLGANGSGKSTLLRLLDALAFPTGGEIRAFGAPLTEDRLRDAAVNAAFRRRVGLVFQNPDVQLFNPTVFDELAFGPLQMDWPRQRIVEAVDAMLDRFGLARLRNRPPHRLSEGEKKRVALASVLILDPEVLLLDEPTAALDPESRTAVLELLARDRRPGRTVITATHDLAAATAVADLGLVLAGGRLERTGPLAGLLDDAVLLRRSGLAPSRMD